MIYERTILRSVYHSTNGLVQTPVKRSWRERLFTLPWKPFHAVRIVYAPVTHYLSDGNKVTVHSADEYI